MGEDSNLRDLVNKDLKKLPAKDTAASKIYFKKGSLALSEGNLDNAIICYDAAVRLDSDNQEARDAAFSTHVTMGDKLFSSDNIKDLSTSVEHYKSALKLNTSDVTVKKKIEKTIEDEKFHSQIRRGVQDFYLGVPASLSKDKIKEKARAFVRDRPDFFLNLINFQWSEYCKELNEEASKFIINNIEDRKKYYRREFSEPNLDILYEKLSKLYSLFNSEFTTVSYSIGTPSIELRPYEVSSHTAKSLCDDFHEQEVGTFLNINQTKVRRLETSDRIIKKTKKQAYGKVYYFENYVAPVSLTLGYHVEIPIRFTYGFKKYGLVRDKLSLDFEVKIKGNIIYDANQGEIIGQQLTSAELIHKTEEWRGYRYVSSGSQLKEDVVKAGCIGASIMLIPGGCVGMCAGGSIEIPIGAMVFGAIIGIVVGSIKYLSRDEWDIESTHDDWVEKHPYTK